MERSKYTRVAQVPTEFKRLHYCRLNQIHARGGNTEKNTFLGICWCARVYFSKSGVLGPATLRLRFPPSRINTPAGQRRVAQGVALSYGPTAPRLLRRSAPSSAWRALSDRFPTHPPAHSVSPSVHPPVATLFSFSSGRPKHNFIVRRQNGSSRTRANYARIVLLRN